MKKFWNWKVPVRNEEAPEDMPQERVLELYGTIAEESWFDDDITPQMFRDELLSGNGPVTVWINSPGGDCIAASQIYSMLMDYKGDVTVKIDGVAASAASVIAMAGTKVLMAPTALLMIHNPATAAFGDHNEMAKAIEMLNEVKESIINAYELKSGLSRAKIAHYMESETWMNAKKAIELGFADGMLEDAKKTDVTVPAYAFSGREVAENLICKIAAHKGVKKAPVSAANAKQEALPTVAPEPAATGEQPVGGRSVSALMERLELIKY